MHLCGAASHVFDNVGCFCYEPTPGNPLRYRASPVHQATGFKMDYALYRACNDLQSMTSVQPAATPGGSMAPPGVAVQGPLAARQALAALTQLADEAKFEEDELEE